MAHNALLSFYQVHTVSFVLLTPIFITQGATKPWQFIFAEKIEKKMSKNFKTEKKTEEIQEEFFEPNCCDKEGLQT